MKLTKLDVEFWTAKKAPEFIKNIDKQWNKTPSIHKVINGHVGGREPLGHPRDANQTQSTLILIRMKHKRMPLRQALFESMGNCPADPRRSARIKKWLIRIGALHDVKLSMIKPHELLGFPTPSEWNGISQQEEKLFLDELKSPKLRVDSMFKVS